MPNIFPGKTIKEKLDDPELVTVREAAQRIHCSPSKIYRLYALGEIEMVKLGRSTRITETSLRSFLHNLKPVTLKPRPPREGSSSS